MNRSRHRYLPIDSVTPDVYYTLCIECLSIFSCCTCINWHAKCGGVLQNEQGFHDHWLMLFRLYFLNHSPVQWTLCQASCALSAVCSSRQGSPEQLPVTETAQTEFADCYWESRWCEFRNLSSLRFRENHEMLNLLWLIQCKFSSPRDIRDWRNGWDLNIDIDFRLIQTKKQKSLWKSQRPSYSVRKYSRETQWTRKQ